MLLSTKIFFSFVNLHFGHPYLLLIQSQMPKYAVAVGRKIGIFDTYDECKEQVLNYPNAKFKKFNTEAEANEYIRNMSVSVSEHSNLIAPLKIENMSQSQLIKVEKISPSNTALNSLNSKLFLIEQKLSNFITSATVMLEDISLRISSIEGQLKRSGDSMESVANNTEPPQKKPKKQVLTDVGDFLYTDSGNVKVYTDGACSNNGKMGAMAGIGVWFNENHPLNVSKPVKGPPTNNTAEIQAARIAITQAARAGVKNLTVYTDSKFLINCITQWIYKWKKNDWKLATGGSVKNKEELEKLDAAIQSVDSVEWIHVQGHQGILGNERADSLARQGASKYKMNVTYASSIEDSF